MGFVIVILIQPKHLIINIATFNLIELANENNVKKFF